MGVQARILFFIHIPAVSASDVVRTAEHGDHFCVAVAGYPEVHSEAWNSPLLPPSEQATRLDLERLKLKVDAGANFILTQFVYDAEVYLAFEKVCARARVCVCVCV
jgi:methylenetetrahydrofolate reductase (NADPH)